MPTYKAPLDEMQFLLYDVFKAQHLWSQSPDLKTLIEPDVANAMLGEAAKFAENCLLPINRSGDEEGAQWHAGEVSTPQGFKSAYEQFCENGFTALCGSAEYGGLGMPKSLAVLIDEMMYAANSSFYLYPALSAGACLAIEAHGSEVLKAQYLPKMYAGIWSGTMCLTEPQAGSDLGLIRTKAVPQGDGSYKVTGTKIFITGGDHDLSENIVHLVLAKLPNAPAGSKGISLFLVPKFWVGDDAERSSNGVSCGSIEHKMGIKGSATCVMNFDSARGYLVGEVNRGLQCMFTMMNCERLSIGIQGLGTAEISYQNALAYAKDRVQGRGSSILGHGDVRRMLLNMKSTTEAGRAFAVYLAMLLDQAKYSDNQEQRVKATAFAALLTPVAKAFFTDLGLDSAILGQQVFGGHGYIREWGQEQLVRDVRIAQIYEGTNGIQAQDLLQRKVYADRGEWLNCYLDEILACCFECGDELQRYAQSLTTKIQEFKQITAMLMERAEQDPLVLGSVACDYLHALGYLSYGYMWLKMMESDRHESTQGAPTSSKQKVGRYYFRRILPRIESLQTTLLVESEVLTDFSDAEF